MIGCFLGAVAGVGVLVAVGAVLLVALVAAWDTFWQRR